MKNKQDKMAKLRSNSGRVAVPYSILWFFLILVAFAGCMLLFMNYVEPYFIPSTLVKGIDPLHGKNPAGGVKMISYDENKKAISYSYVPRELRARSGDEVGYILSFKTEEKRGSGWRDNRPVAITIQQLKLTLKDYRNNTVIISRTMEPPSFNDSTYFSVSESDAMEWVLEQYRQYNDLLRNNEYLAGLATYKQNLSDGEIWFSVQLTPEQVSKFDSASLLFVIPAKYGSDEYQGLFEYGNVTIDDKGLLSARCKPKAFYALNENEEIICGPLPCSIEGNGVFMIQVIYLDGPTLIQSNDKSNLCYYYSVDSADRLVPLRIRVANTENIYNTDEEVLPGHNFVKALFWAPVKRIVKNYGSISGFDVWPETGFSETSIDLPVDWHFGVKPLAVEDRQVCATFQIKDKNGDVYSSEIIKVFGN